MPIVIQLRDCAFDVQHIPAKPGQAAAKVMAACPKLPQLVRELGPEAATELRKEYSA